MVINKLSDHVYLHSQQTIRTAKPHIKRYRGWFKGQFREGDNILYDLYGDVPLDRANNFWNAGNGRGVRTCTSVLRLLGCYSLQFDASKKERSNQIFFLGRLFARVKKKKAL